MDIRLEDYATSQGKELLRDLRDRFVLADTTCRNSVADILEQVRTRGDDAVIQYTRKFDAPQIELSQFKVTSEEFDQAAEKVDEQILETIAFAAQRIRQFHERELEDSWFTTREDGTITGRMVRPVDSAGLYVPGGQGGSTPLVSSVLMNGIPAAIAGVGRRVMMTPPDSKGRINAALLMAAREIGITEVYKAGSAWAIAALAFGTETIAPVDVIVGPGNQFVTEAKRQVMGRVRIDMIAGPSEVLIVADSTANPAYVAADMLAQAEHDPQALAMLITTDKTLASKVTKQLEIQLPALLREDIARKSLADRGTILLVDSVEQGIKLANEVAVEHLELQVEEPWQWLPAVKHAGAIFLGHHTPEAAGDYVAGPNHVLPTMGTARISSALGVETFVKKSSIISYSKQALYADADHIQRLAGLEGLGAHANSVAVRVK